ncbi:hypothetical protein PTKIN_Ptkin01aG0351800 [Pterospermum kingtungense]
MEFKHFLDPHNLSFTEVGKENDSMCCRGCLDIIYGSACSCSRAEMPPQIQTVAFHPHRSNSLSLSLYDVVVRDGCAKLWGGWISYKCMYCTFNLDFKCALSISNDYYELPNRETLHQGKRIKTTIHHFRHYNQLTRCKYSLFTTEFVKEFFKEFFKFSWGVCRDKVEGFGFYCNQCDVNLHVSCAKYQTRAIKHNCHPDHHLLNLGKSIMSEICCNACDKDCGSFFSCIKCGFYIHVECIPLPPRAQHTRHLHPLMLTNPVVEDDSREYSCDACERERNGEHHVYYCEEREYVSHIGCALSEVKH